MIGRRASVATLAATLLVAGACASTTPKPQPTEIRQTPRYAIYYNSNSSPAAALVGLPYTHVILSFLTVDEVADDAIALSLAGRLTDALTQIPALQADGKAVLVSFGGGDMDLADYAAVADRVDDLADAIEAIVSDYGFDGVDIDFEASASLHQTRRPGIFDGRVFLVELTRALRVRLAPGAVITHAPQGPYLDPGWHGGPYLDVLRQAGDAVHWISVQYYNNPHFDAPISADIVGNTDAPAAWSYTGLAQGLGGLDWPPQKTLVGLPVADTDAANGYLPPATVRDRIVCPLARLYGPDFGGLTGWQFSTRTDDHRFWNSRMAQALSGAGCGS